jgi:methionyl-tRNA formyltransferase
MGCGLMKRTIAGIVDGTLQPLPQDHSRATLAPILRKEDGNMDWNLPAASIHNRIRAFNPWPGTRTTFRGQACRVLKSRLMARDLPEAPTAPGTILTGRKGERSLAVICGDRAPLELLEVQLPNRKPQTGTDFVNGFRVLPGEILGHPGQPVG